MGLSTTRMSLLEFLGSLGVASPLAGLYFALCAFASTAWFAVTDLEWLRSQMLVGSATQTRGRTT